MRHTIAAMMSIFWGSVAGAQAQSVLPPATDALVTSAGALAKSAGDLVDLGPTTYRLNEIKSAFRASLKQAKADTPLSLGILDELALLCHARSEANALKLTAQRNYLQSLSGKIDALGKPTKIENLSDAIGSLFASQSLDIKGLPDRPTLANAAKSIETTCEADLKQIDVSYYAGDKSAQPQSEKSLASFTAIGSLIDTIVAIITPVIVEGAKIIDEQKRRDVVQKYLQGKGISTQISDSARELAAGVVASVDAKRQGLAGSFNENLVVLRSKKVDISKLGACADFLKDRQDGTSVRASGAPNDGFVACWQAAWAEAAPLISATLKSANDYDQLADAGSTKDAQKNVSDVLTSLAKITNPNAQLSAADLTYFWNITVELLAFADKVNAAASADNQKKIGDAIDKLVKSM